MWHFSYNKWFQCRSPHQVHIDKSCADTMYFIMMWRAAMMSATWSSHIRWKMLLVTQRDEFLLCFLHLVDFLYLTSGFVHVPRGTLVSEESSCVVDHSRLILLLSAHRAGFPPRKPLKGLQTCPVENMRARQQHLKGNMRICLSIWEVQSWTHVMKPEAAAEPNLELELEQIPGCWTRTAFHVFFKCFRKALIQSGWAHLLCLCGP